MPEIDRLLERLRQRRDQRATELAAGERQAVSSVHGTRVAHAIGTRVFDPITGEEGVVIGGTSENVVVPVARRADR